MKFINLFALGAVTLAVTLVYHGAEQPLPAQTAGESTLAESGAMHWHSFSECPVLVDKAVDVPALESGIVEKIDVELNANVQVGQCLAILDEELALMELKIAKLQHNLAVELANDTSDIEYLRLALKEAKQEFDDNSKIKASVGVNELRRLMLGVGRAELSVQRAEQALKRAGVEAELKAASVQAATLRVNRRRILSPLGGIVTAIHRQTGQAVESGQAIFTVTDLQQVVVDCLVPIEKVNLKRIVGLDVRVQCEQRGLGDQPVRLAGKISSYDPTVSSEGYVRVHAKIQNARQDNQWLLLSGMTVKLEVGIPTGEPTLIGRKPSQQR